MTQLLTQQDLLQHAQQLQHLAQLQRQQNQLAVSRNPLAAPALSTSLASLPATAPSPLNNMAANAVTNSQKKAKKKLFTQQQLLPQQQLQQQQLQQQQFHQLQVSEHFMFVLVNLSLSLNFLFLLVGNGFQ